MGCGEGGRWVFTLVLVLSPQLAKLMAELNKVPGLFPRRPSSQSADSVSGRCLGSLVMGGTLPRLE